MERAKKLAEAHWDNYVEPLLEAHNIDADSIKVAEFHYVSAFIHGYGHGQEDEDQRIDLDNEEYRKKMVDLEMDAKALEAKATLATIEKELTNV